ncbi:MAG: ATP synthase F0 subunit B, partial [Deltaproteobacteria bacterium]|nr:ATP synthase F0 subunit B [Deltaproteobacteria bacterium]
MFNIDQTLIFQIIGFLALLFLLNNFLYKPIIKVLTERKERTDGVTLKAALIDKEVAEGLVAYEKRIKEAVVKGNEERGKLRSEAHGMEKEILSKAGAEAVKETAAMKRSLEESKRTALESLKAGASAISRDIAEKLLERKTALIFFAFIMPLLPIIASAAEEEAGHGGPNMIMVWKIVNFAVLAAAVYFLWTKVLSKLLRERSADIE